MTTELRDTLKKIDEGVLLPDERTYTALLFAMLQVEDLTRTEEIITQLAMQHGYSAVSLDSLIDVAYEIVAPVDCDESQGEESA